MPPSLNGVSRILPHLCSDTALAARSPRALFRVRAGPPRAFARSATPPRSSPLHDVEADLTAP